MDSPHGAFTDVMTEDRDGLRTLLAPNRAVADYVSATYRFDEVVVAPLDASPSPAGERGFRQQGACREGGLGAKTAGPPSQRPAAP